MIKNFKDYFVFAYPILVLLGFLNLSIYYHFFNVPIKNYLEISEIITVFLDDAIVVSFMMVVFAFGCLMGIRIGRLMFGKMNSIANYFPSYKGFIYFVGISIIVIVVYFLYNHSFKFGESIESSIKSSMYVIILIISIYLGFTENTEPKRWFYILSSIFFIMLCYQMFLEIRNVKYNYSTNGTEINYHENNNYVEFVSDSTNYFIGKTKNYVFIFNSINSTTKVIPMKNVDQMVLVNNRKIE